MEKPKNPEVVLKKLNIELLQKVARYLRNVVLASGAKVQHLETCDNAVLFR